MAHAGPKHIGRFCRLCGKPITLHQLIQITGPGEPPVHRICWERGGEESRADISETEVAAGSAAIAGGPSAEARGVAQAFGLKVFLMIMSVLLALIGPMIGIVVGFLWMDAKNSPLRRRDGRELLIFCALLFVLQLIFLACVIGGAVDLFQTGDMGPPPALPFLP